MYYYLKRLFYSIHIPKELHSNKGTVFSNKLTNELFHILRIRKVFGAYNRPQFKDLTKDFIRSQKTMPFYVTSARNTMKWIGLIETISYTNTN